ncbi:MAG: OmpA family protein [Nitrospiria bacterium]
MNKNSVFWSLSTVIFLSLFLFSCTKRLGSFSGTAEIRDDHRDDETPESENSAFPLEIESAQRSTPVEIETPEKPKNRLRLRGRTQGETGGLSDIYFEYNQDVLDPASKEALQKNAQHLMLHPNIKVQIEGHTDERGGREYNLALGARRAKKVERFLEALGIHPARMSIISFGEEKPFCREKEEENCWQQNRRTHFKIKQ